MLQSKMSVAALTALSTFHPVGQEGQGEAKPLSFLEVPRFMSIHFSLSRMKPSGILIGNKGWDMLYYVIFTGSVMCPASNFEF